MDPDALRVNAKRKTLLRTRHNKMHAFEKYPHKREEWKYSGLAKVCVSAEIGLRAGPPIKSSFDHPEFPQNYGGAGEFQKFLSGNRAGLSEESCDIPRPSHRIFWAAALPTRQGRSNFDAIRQRRGGVFGNTKTCPRRADCGLPPRVSHYAP